MQQQQVGRLVRAIHRWLSFQRSCGREAFFSESYLSQPTAEYISAHHRGRISPEHGHPQFTKLSAGRPKQVDFALMTPNANDVELVIETKWVRDRPYSKQAVMDDLLRLECFRDANRHVRRYFVVAGLRDSLDANFLKLRYTAVTKSMFLPEILDPALHADEKVVDAFSAPPALRKYYRNFEQEYAVEVPRRFKTKLIARSRLDGIAVYMWRVASMPNRQTFSPAAEWRSPTASRSPERAP